MENEKEYMPDKMGDELTNLVAYKQNKDFTSEQVISQITESFIIMSNLLEESSTAKQNVKSMYGMLDDIVKITENFEGMFENSSELQSILSAELDLNKKIAETNTLLQEFLKTFSVLTDEIRKINDKGSDDSYEEIYKEEEDKEIKKPFLEKRDIITIIGFIALSVIILIN